MHEGMNVLDAGCGTGFFSRFFCEQGHQTVALDYSDEALAITKKMTQGNATLLKADMLTENLQEVVDARYDLIFSDGLFEHFPMEEQDRILQNLKSVLSETGVIVTFVPNRWSPWELIRPFMMPGIKEDPFVLSELKRMNQRNGLEVVHCGGVNVFPFALSPDRILGKILGMLLFTVARK